MTRRRMFVKICILAVAVLMIVSFSSRTVYATNGKATAKAKEAPGAPTLSPDIAVIEISLATPTPVPTPATATDTPTLSPTPEPASTPDPVSASDPASTPDPSSVSEPSSTPDPTLNPDPASTASPTAVPSLTPTLSPTATPSPTPVPSPTATPSPSPTPSPDPKEVALLAAKNGLSEYRRPNRMRYTDVDDILQTLPDDLGLPRTLIVLKAYSLLGKVAYQFGGKSSEMGWDPIWNTAASTKVKPDGTVTVTEFGLDCSGYVRWCFINAAGTSEMGRRFGSGTYKQWINSESIPLAEAMPGDLVFTNEVGRTNHDGIVVQNDGDGTIMVLHNAIDKGVVLESAEEGGFKYARRPDILRGKNLQTFEASAFRHRNETFMADLRYLLAIREW